MKAARIPVEMTAEEVCAELSAYCWGLDHQPDSHVVTVSVTVGTLRAARRIAGPPSIGTMFAGRMARREATE